MADEFPGAERDDEATDTDALDAARTALSRVAELEPTAYRARDILDSTRERFEVPLARTEGFAAGAADFVKRSRKWLSVDSDWTHPMACRNLGGFLTHVLDDLAPILDDADQRAPFEAGVRAAIAATARQFVIDVAPQPAELDAALDEVVRRLGSFPLQKSKIIVLELPVGNAVPAKLLLEKLAEAGLPATTQRRSMSRSDDPALGRTRHELLEGALKDANVAPNDVVVYIDEWESGKNFRYLTEILQPLVEERRAILFPAALMAGDVETRSKPADLEARFKHHDALTLKLGMTGTDLRFRISTVSHLHKKRPFFWSEDDRVAGYRKLQLLGAILSTIDAALEELARDEAKAGNAASRAFADDAPLAARAHGELGNWRKEFARVRKDLEKTPMEGAVGADEDMNVALGRVVAALSKALRGNEGATLAFALGKAHADLCGTVNPAIRYSSQSVVPEVMPLPPPLNYLHECVMAELRRKAWRT